MPGITTTKTVMCSSRKYPYPHLPPRRATEIPRGEKVQEKAIFEGLGSCFLRLVLITVKLSVHLDPKFKTFPDIIPNQYYFFSRIKIINYNRTSCKRPPKIQRLSEGGSRLQESKHKNKTKQNWNKLRTILVCSILCKYQSIVHETNRGWFCTSSCGINLNFAEI